MATFVMEAFRYTDATSDNVWAVCVDGPRVITHWGQSGAKLQGGAPVKMRTGESPQETMTNLSRQKISQGFRPTGSVVVVDGFIQPTNEQATAPAPRRLFPDTYAELVLLDEWHGAVRHIATKLNLSFAEDGVGGLLVYVGQGEPVKFEPGEASIVKAMPENGPKGRLLILAISKYMGRQCFDADGKTRDAAWLREDPDGFRDESLTSEDVQELAEKVGLVMARLKFKPDINKSSGLFA